MLLSSSRKLLFAIKLDMKVLFLHGAPMRCCDTIAHGSTCEGIINDIEKAMLTEFLSKILPRVLSNMARNCFRIIVKQPEETLDAGCVDFAVTDGEPVFTVFGFGVDEDNERGSNSFYRACAVAIVGTVNTVAEFDDSTRKEKPAEKIYEALLSRPEITIEMLANALELKKNASQPESESK